VVQFVREAPNMRSSAAALIAVAGCTNPASGRSGIVGDRLFEERTDTWPRMSRVALCDNGRFTIDTGVEVNTDVGTYVQDVPRTHAVTGTATGASREIDSTPFIFHYTIALGEPNVLTAPELMGSWEQLGDAKSLDEASSACALVATFALP
jgi:hypothetical protein